jgi:hypothetical protein
MSDFYNTTSEEQQSARHCPQGRFSLEGAILIVDTEEDAHAAREHLGMEAFVFDRLAEQLPPGGLSTSSLVVSRYGAYERATGLIDQGAPRMGVMFVDLAPLQGQTLKSMAEQESTRTYLISLLQNPSDPILHFKVRPLPDWEEREPSELIGCGDAAIQDGLVWQFPSITTCVGGYGCGKSTLAALFALKAMLTPEGMAQNLKASFCAFEDDLTDFKNRSMAHVLRGDLREPDLRAVLDLQNRLWWYDERLPRPRGLDEWKDQVRVMAIRHGVRWHVIDPWTAHLPDFEKGEEMPGYVNRQMNDLQQLARELKIAIHIVAHTPKAATQGIGKIKPIRVNDTLGSGDFGKLSDYGICVVSSPYLANLKRGAVRNDNDFDEGDIAAANACTPFVDAGSHMVVAIDKVKRRGVMGQPGVYAFAYDAHRNDVIYDAGASMLVRKIWSV